MSDYDAWKQKLVEALAARGRSLEAFGVSDDALLERFRRGDAPDVVAQLIANIEDSEEADGDG